MRLKTYWHVLVNLLTSPEYYLKVITTKFSFSLRFFIMSMILLGLISAWRINQLTIPEFHQDAKLSLDELQENYPANLEINWADGKLSSSATYDIEISYPSFVEKNDQLPPTLGYYVPQNLAIDEIGDRFDKKSLILITSQQLMINDLRGNWNQLPLKDLILDESFTLNKESIAAVVTQAKLDIGPMVELIKKINYLVMPVILVISKSWMALMEGFLVYLLFRLNQLKISFTRVYQFSLHLVVIAEIINQLTSWVYPHSLISMFSFAYWVIFSFVFWTQRKQFSQLKF